ncbi:hypothetical protein MCL36_12600 [Acinetobacter pittii]|nr:hypothetical protein [Acinetobacter pittii]
MQESFLLLITFEVRFSMKNNIRMTKNKSIRNVMNKILLICLIVSAITGCTSDGFQEARLDVESIKNTDCIPNEAEKLIGQTVPSEEELKKRTNAGIVRISFRGEPVSSDLRPDRLSVVVNSESKIIYAACV